MYVAVASNTTDEVSKTLSITTDCWFHEGDKFHTIEDLTTKIEQFEEENHVQLWKRDAKLIASQSKKIDRFLKPELKYYHLKYCCLHGGKKFKGEGKGIRPNTMYVC